MSDLDLVLRRCGGAAARSLLVRHGISRHTIDNEVKRGMLVTAATDVYCRPWDVDDIELRERAALLALGRAAALSHLTGLRRWDLLPTDLLEVHVSVPDRRCPRSTDRRVVHRVARFPPVVRLRGLVTVTPATAVSTSWPLLTNDSRRAPVIDAVRRRLATPADLRESLNRQPRLAGRRQLGNLVDLLEAGCESELEIRGLLTVFDTAGLRHGQRQHAVAVGGRRFRLDVAFIDERLAVELDGARFHSGPAERENDLRRDAMLAAAGWQVLRLSYRRLHEDVDGCRRDILATLAARRRR